MRLSHSKLDKFKTCGKMYDLHYNHKIRPETVTSPLIFGVAMDEALNVMLAGNNDYKQVFDSKFSSATVNGQLVQIAEYPLIKYNKNDFDKRFLLQEDYDRLMSKHYNTLEFKSGQDFVSFVEELATLKVITQEEQIVYNLVNWLALRRKGHVLLDAYKEQIIPNIKSVTAIQKNISLKNDSGDEFIGIVDFIAVWSDNNEYIFDNKTSNRPYKLDAVAQSAQLMAYSEELGIHKAGFIVMQKQIPWEQQNSCSKCGYSDVSRRSLCPNKCGSLNKIHVPKPVIQVVLDDVSERNRDEMFTEIQYLTDEIKAGNFTPNLEKCNNVYGQRCPYYDYCRSGSMNKLVKIDSE